MATEDLQPLVNLLRGMDEAAGVEMERLEARVQELERERDEARRALGSIRHESIEMLEDRDLEWMDRKNLEAHYNCTLANWSIVLDERDAAQARADRYHGALLAICGLHSDVQRDVVEAGADHYKVALDEAFDVASEALGADPRETT